MKVWRGEGDFLTFLKADPEISQMLFQDEVLEEKFDLGYHTKHVDTIFRTRFWFLKLLAFSFVYTI